jgi:YVTN family beta-propeller protein
MRLRLLVVCLLLSSGCSSSDAAAGGAGTGGAGGTGGGAAGVAGGSSSAGKQLALVAEWLNQRLSIIDVGALKDGATRASVLVAEIDLSKYTPGPLDLAVSADGKLALVTISSSFFGFSGAAAYVGETSIPMGESTLLWVDLEKRAVVGELDTGADPMSPTFTRDGKTAFVAHFSSNDVTVVDVEKKSVISQVAVGPFSEEIALDDTGTVGILSYSAAGNVITFDPADLPGTQTSTSLTADAAGVTFFPGTKTAYVVQAATPLDGNMGGHTIVDVTNPKMPVVSEDVRVANQPGAYPVIAVPKRHSVVIPATQNSMLTLEEVKLGADGKVVPVQNFSLVPVTTLGAYAGTVDPAGRLLLASPGEHFIVVVDLETQKTFTVPWGQTKAGPSFIALLPAP